MGSSVKNHKLSPLKKKKKKKQLGGILTVLLLVVMAWSEEETIALIELWGDECIQEQLETVQETELCTINFLDKCKRQDSPGA